jgi:hypothetical protein
VLGYRTVVDACPASSTKIQLDRTSAFADLDLEIARFALDLFQIRIGDHLDVQVPADLDQYG